MPRWIVFGRTEYAEPLREHGMVDAVDQDEAARRALERYGGGWVELSLVPEGAMRWVLRAVDTPA